MQRNFPFASFLFLVFIVFIPSLIKAQCEVTISSVIDSNVCGDCITLNAYGQGQGQQVFSEDFNSGNPSGWAFTQQATFTNPCSPNGVDGTTHIWMGDLSAVPRSLETVSYDLTPATAGVTICFDLLFAEQGNASPCEGPDEPDEGVYLQYSIDGGNTWIDIHYFDPNGGNDPDLINWNNWCFSVPAAAITTNTRFRFFQDADSGAEYDHWGIDNVNIYYNDPTYNITWDHDNYSYGAGSSGGNNPTPVCPTATTTYTVEMSNGSSTCYDSVTVLVVNPVLEVNAGNDTTICSNNCAQFNATSKVIKKPAKTPTYTNSETAPVIGLPDPNDIANLILPCLDFNGCTCPDGSSVSFGGQCPTSYTGVIEMNINITDLNTNSLQNGQLTSVCIGDLTLVSGFGDLTPYQIILICPSGGQIVLANSGNISGFTLTGACFDLSASAPISTGSSPYTGNWQPVEPFSNLNGCDPNGVWTIQLIGNYDFVNGDFPAVGALNGWSISFDDPEISYEADYTWTPVTGLNNPNTLSPIACPTSDQEYILTASDSAGCITISDTILVQVDSVCCNLEFDATVQAPSCGQSDGSITLNITQGSGNYNISWSNSQSGTSINGLAAGIYSATIEDLGQSNCIKDTTFTLSNPGAPNIVADTGIAETCLGANDGIAGIVVVGGTPPYSFLWSNNATDSVIFNLTAGNYDVTVSDNNGCEATTSINVAAGPNCCNISLSLSTTNPVCGQSNGSISVSVLNGSGNYNYTWSPSGSGNTLNSLSAGTYNLTVEDLSQVNCTLDTSITLSGVVISGATVDTAICANDPITINGVVYNSPGAYTYTLQTPSGCDSVINLNVTTIQAIGSAPDPNFFNTGNNGSGGTLPGGTNDLSWEVAVNNYNGPYNPAVVMSSIPSSYYSSPFPDAEWISHSASGAHSGSIDYFYKIEFDLPCMDSCGRNFSDQNAFCLALDFFSDNSVFELYVNGIPQSSQIPGIPVGNPYFHQGFTQSGMLSIGLCDEWRPGTNTLILHVASAGGFAGFLAQTSVNIPPYIAPYDTIPTTIFAPDTLTVDGVDIFEPGLYTFELTNSFGCDSNVVLEVDVIPLFFTDVYDTICLGDQFQFNNNNYTQTGEYTDTLLSSVGQDSIVTLHLQVNEVTLSLSSVEISCFDANDGSITATATTDNPPLQYNWSNSSTDTFINNLSPGSYILEVIDQDNCSISDTVVLYNPDELTVDLGPDITLCFGESETLDAGQYSTYLWSTGDSSGSIIATSSGTYEVTVTDTNGCEATNSVFVDISDSLVVDAGPDTSIVEFNNAQLQGLINGSTNPSGLYIWSPEFLLSCENCLDPITNIIETQEFVLTYTDANNCVKTDTVLVEVLEGEYHVYIPTAFSPNGDGLNDLYSPIMEGVDRFVLRIFDRWGELLYESRDLEDQWDGTYKGNIVDPGVYTYSIYAEFINLETFRRSGSLTILR